MRPALNTWRRILPLTFLLCLGAPATGYAAEGNTPVGELFDQAQAAFAKGDKQAAYTAYLKAWGLQKSYDIAGNLGNVELRLGKHRDAAEHLSYGVTNFPPTGEPSLLRVMKQKLAETQKEIGRVTVRVSVAGVRVRVNGREVGISPLSEEAYVEPGEVVVEGELAGCEPARMVGRVGKGEAVEMKVVMIESKKPNFGILIAGGAVTVAGLGAGIGLLVAGNSKIVDADEERASFQKSGLACPNAAIATQCKSVRETLSSASTLHNASVGMFIGANVVNLATIVLMLSPLGKTAGVPKAGRTRLVPVVGGSLNGILISGSF